MGGGVRAKCNFTNEDPRCKSQMLIRNVMFKLNCRWADGLRDRHLGFQIKNCSKLISNPSIEFVTTRNGLKNPKKNTQTLGSHFKMGGE